SSNGKTVPGTQTDTWSKLNRALIQISKSLSSWTPAPVRGLVTIFLSKRSSFFGSGLSSTASLPIWPSVQLEEILKSEQQTLVQVEPRGSRGSRGKSNSRLQRTDFGDTQTETQHNQQQGIITRTPVRLRSGPASSRLTSSGVKARPREFFR